MILRHNTADQYVWLGPFVDSTDGNTTEEGLTIANTDVKLIKHNASAAVNASVGGVHGFAGNYYVQLAAADTDTIGNLIIVVHVAGALYCKEKCIVYSQARYDYEIGSFAPSTLTAAGIRTSIGMSAANLDAQLAAKPDSSAFPTNFFSLAVNATGQVQASNLSDLLTQAQFNAALPANFKDLLVSASTGRVQVGTNHDKTGYALTPAEHDAIAVEVESHLLDEGDSQMLINAIVQAIGNQNIDEVALVAAIRSDLERSGGNLNTLLARATETRLAKLDITGDLANTDNANSFKADVSGLLTQTQFNAALPNNFDQLIINVSGEVVASNMVAPAPDVSAIQGAAGQALVDYQAAKTSDLAGLLTQTHFDASLPANFGSLSIDTSGYVTTVDGGDVNVVSVGGTAVSGPNDLKADVSNLVHKTDLPTRFNILSIDTAGRVTAVGGGGGGGGATAEEIWTYHERTLTTGGGGNGTPMGLRRYLGTIYYGFDYVGTDAIKVSEQSAGEWDSAKLSGSFFMMLTDGRAGSVTVPATLSTNGGINTLSADLEGTLIPKRPGEYQAFFYSVEAGTGSTQDTRLIVPALLTVQRGLSEC